ncbi:MAG TPA: DUF1801 domain-containing protein [Bacteroidia bacterium]|nr:DUF1801 domain-containing protein [Bacteroidia bacterium]
MRSEAITADLYLQQVPEERRKVMRDLRAAIRSNLPAGFEEVMAYGMIGYVVPHKLYPQGYHADPKQALPFMNLASQKNHIAVYHMAIYGNPELKQWFCDSYEEEYHRKADIGKGCIRFKKPEHVPVNLIGQLASKLSVKAWIMLYQKNIGL